MSWSLDKKKGQAQLSLKISRKGAHLNLRLNWANDGIGLAAFITPF